ncbi:VanZ family protein [Planctomycetaceae bacterium SH139]
MRKLPPLPWYRWFYKWLFLATICSTVLLVYASIVPLQYTPLSWQETWSRWAEVPWLQLGVYNRADWVANALVVIPPSFLATGACWFAFRAKPAQLASAVLVGVAFGCLVYLIEFVQLWFPPRTVSQNDIFAGCIGAGIGPVVWLVAGPSLAGLLVSFAAQPTIRKRLAVLTPFGMGAAVLYSVFPLDIVVTSAELQQKWDNGRISLSLGIDSLFQREMLKGVSLSLIRAIPFGLWFGFAGNRVGRASVAIALIAIGLEAIQIPIFSKYATIWEIVGGIAGGLIGWWLGSEPKLVTRSLGNPGLSTAGIGCFLILAPLAMLGRFETVVHDPDLLVERWKGFWTPPLLRYYYTSEYAALTNLAGKLGMFAAFGVCVAGWCWAKRGRHYRSVFVSGLFVAGGLGLGIEAAQVYLEPFHGDATDVLIYMTGYWVGYAAGRTTLFGAAGYRPHEPAGHSASALGVHSFGNGQC